MTSLPVAEADNIVDIDMRVRRDQLLGQAAVELDRVQRVAAVVFFSA